MKIKCVYQALQVLIILLVNQIGLAAQGTAETKVSSYIGIVHPIYTIQNSDFSTNFTDYYQMGMTMGVVIKKAPNYAFNLELVGFVRSENDTTKSNNLMLHPGVSFYLPKNWGLTPRAGFETSGRFGPSLIVSKLMGKAGGHPINFNLVNLLRFGNGKGTSFTNAINITFGF